MSAETLTEEGSGPRTAYSVVRVHVRCCNWSAELCRNCVRSPRNRRQTATFTGSHREAFCGGKSLNPLREEMFPYRSVSVAGFVFQACSIDHSDISPFRINDLRAARNSVSQNPPSNRTVPRCDLHSAVCGRAETERRRNCVRPPNVPRSLTAILLSRRAQIVGTSKRRSRRRSMASRPPCIWE